MPGALRDIGLARLITLWLLFFSFCLALGYSTLNRYDARKLGRDQDVYYKMVLGTASTTPYDIPFRFRVLVPSVAQPFYWIARGRVATWDPVWFGMLIANSLFCATFSILLLLMGYKILGDLPVTLLGCTLVLLNYAVPDLWLSGYVDASEACLLMAVALSLLSDEWRVLPFIGIVGGLSKQTFLPFATVFAIVWWLSTERSRRTFGQLLCILGMAGTAFASIVVTYRVIAGSVMMPWSMAAEWWGGGTFLSNLWVAITDHGIGYPFFWLLPLGVWRLNRFPRPWVNATIVTGLFVFGFAGYHELGGTVNRPIFNVIGPLFSLSVASLIATGGPWQLGGQAHRANG